MKILETVGMGVCIGALTIMTHPVAAGQHGGTRDMRTANAGAEHGIGLLACAGCGGHAKANPRTPAVAPAKAGNPGAEAKQAEAKVLKAQTTCPVMKGQKINPELYVDHEGKRIYVCCGTCLRRAQADPKAVLKALREQGVAPAKAVADDKRAPKDRPAEARQKHQH